MIELRHLRYFIAVADHRHFTAAAASLGIQQPPLSIQIRNLEKDVGTPLLRRLPRQIELTEAGKTFYQDACSIVAAAEAAPEHARRAARGELGNLRVGMINSAPFHPLIPRVLREYRQEFPKVSLTLEEDSTPELADRVRTHALDLAFIRPLLEEEPDLVTEALFSEDMLVALPQGHPLLKRSAVSLASLSLERFVLFPRSVGSGLYDEIIAACRRAGFSPRIAQEASQVTSIVNLVAAGLGVSLVPASMQKIHSMGVSYRPIRGDAPVAHMSMVHRRGEASATVHQLRQLARSLARSLR
jgi:DNA-binding transcriptional LysR family regulator